MNGRTQCAVNTRLITAIERLKREEATGVLCEQFVVDLLADVRHYCDAHTADFGKLDRTAYQQYIKERHSPEEPPACPSAAAIASPDTLTVHVAIPLNAWSECEHPLHAGMSHLAALMVINGVYHQVDAFEIRTEGGRQLTVDAQVQSAFDHYRSAARVQAPLKTVSMFRRQYVLCMTPSCS